MLPTFEAFGGNEPALDPLATIVAAFREGAALVDAALQALTPIAKELDVLRAATAVLDTHAINQAAIGNAVASIRHHLEGATVSGDNLLIEDGRRTSKTLLVFGLSRQASGAVTTQSISVDREAIVLMGAAPDSPRAFNRLAAAADDGQTPLGPRIDTMAGRVAAAASRLSIVKARVGLQSSFIEAVASSGMPNLSCQLGSDLDQSGIRNLALATKLLLSRKALDIGSGNRKVLQTLFASHRATLADK